jgi:flavodoxin
MNIGIIVYSKSGNTLLVAEKIRASLTRNGFQAELLRFQAEPSSPGSNAPIRLSAVPNPNGYDALIFGSPVQAFSLDPAMQMYLQQVGEIKKVPALCFITQHFKKPWMGGNRAMKQLQALLQGKGIHADAAGVVNWSSEMRETQIDAIAKQCVETLKRG